MPVNTKSSVSPKNLGKGKKVKIDKKKEAKKAPHFCDDDNFDENLKIIRIEHCIQCPVFAEKSLEVFEDLTKMLPNYSLKLMVNEHFDGILPKYGSFEIYFAKNCREKYQLIWSGLHRGPPRREKFPDQSDYDNYILKTINAILKTYDVCFFFCLSWVCCGDRCLILRSVERSLKESHKLLFLPEFA